MLSDTEKSALANIRYFIDLIASFLKGYDYQHFALTCIPFTRSHVALRSYPRRQGVCRRTSRRGIPRCSGGKWPPQATSTYRHEYEDVAQQLVWATVHDALPPLRANIDSELGPYE
jgi:hypothetical protein